MPLGSNLLCAATGVERIGALKLWVYVTSLGLCLLRNSSRLVALVPSVEPVPAAEQDSE